VILPVDGREKRLRVVGRFGPADKKDTARPEREVKHIKNLSLRLAVQVNK
jgi:hypothetical protein